MPKRSTRLAVIGGGWAGLAAAVEGTLQGHDVTLFEMSTHLGGRSRGVEIDGLWLDNGQHILIGAYHDTLRLMQAVGVDLDAVLLRMPLRLTDPQSHGLHLRPGSPASAFASAVLRHDSWRWRDKAALLLAASRWRLSGFRCDPAQTVAGLTAGLPTPVKESLIEPLCVAALNTPAHEASATVFLRILKDALFSGYGSADLLLPRTSLSHAFPLPAAVWLQRAGARIQCSRRIQSLEARADGWRLDAEDFDHVVLASTAVEAARLTQSIAPEWSHTAASLRHEPIVTVYVHSPGTRLPDPMLTLRSDEHAPAQFVFDKGRLGGPEGLLAFVISGAQPWVDRGLPFIENAVLEQARTELSACLQGSSWAMKSFTEKRATFRCTPGLARPGTRIAQGLYAAGDYVDGPYPATLEGAVRSAVAAVSALC